MSDRKQASVTLNTQDGTDVEAQNRHGWRPIVVLLYCIVFASLLSACNKQNHVNTNSIVGKWVSTADAQETIAINPNGSVHLSHITASIFGDLPNAYPSGETRKGYWRLTQLPTCATADASVDLYVSNHGSPNPNTDTPTVNFYVYSNNGTYTGFFETGDPDDATYYTFRKI